MNNHNTKAGIATAGELLAAAYELTGTAADGTMGKDDMEAEITGKGAELPPMAEEGIHAGFPSPASGYMTGCIDLNRELVKHPAATFYGRVIGDSMIDAGVEEGDILVIDRAIEAKDGDMAVCFVDGEFTLKTIDFCGVSPAEAKELWLRPANKTYKPIRVSIENDFTIWGVVSYVIKKVRR